MNFRKRYPRTMERSEESSVLLSSCCNPAMCSRVGCVAYEIRREWNFHLSSFSIRYAAVG
jgi:hypothetical protein